MAPEKDILSVRENFVPAGRHAPPRRVFVAKPKPRRDESLMGLFLAWIVEHQLGTLSLFRTLISCLNLHKQNSTSFDITLTLVIQELLLISLLCMALHTSSSPALVGVPESFLKCPTSILQLACMLEAGMTCTSFSSGLWFSPPCERRSWIIS